MWTFPNNAAAVLRHAASAYQWPQPLRPPEKRRERRRERRRSLLFLAPLQPLLLLWLPPAQGHPGGAGRAVGAGCRNGTAAPAWFCPVLVGNIGGDQRRSTLREARQQDRNHPKATECSLGKSAPGMVQMDPSELGDCVLGTVRARDALSPSPQGHGSRHQRAPEPRGVPSTAP